MAMMLLVIGSYGYQYVVFVEARPLPSAPCGRSCPRTPAFWGSNLGPNIVGDIPILRGCGCGCVFVVVARRFLAAYSISAGHLALFVYGMERFEATTTQKSRMSNPLALMIPPGNDPFSLTSKTHPRKPGLLDLFIWGLILTLFECI